MVLSDLNIEGVERVDKEISDGGGAASAIEQDTAKKAHSEKVVKYAVETYGALHLAALRVYR